MDWLPRLIDKLFCFIPRIWLVHPDESGIRLTFGKRIYATKPGWYLYLPLFQVCTKITVTPQVVDLRPQSVFTADKKDLCIGGGVMYRVKDATNALLKVQDYDKSLQTLALGIISQFISEHNSDSITINEIEGYITKGIKEHARGWGIEIMHVYVTDLGSARNIRLLTDVPVVSTTPIIDEARE